MPTKPAGNGTGSKTSLSRDIQSHIGDQLRAMHDDIVKQGIPDRFVDLLSRLEVATKNVAGR
jgi:hypothetical protein